ncbi:aminoacyl-tRNA deacylase and HDOD domain-containing protein [Aliikangiella coralliicola]|uniref:HDOD domain-containing protein n=1 Tax=Aliikangiella coralliicola TaxID=2592383 RepID=A0A545U670_9GAMM|nr:HDOD domain-containing protein [Aliikangiella coralliicola]TQV84903.1 HDOD domain-containing protein [Aliikangiella coralliicola]
MAIPKSIGEYFEEKDIECQIIELPESMDIQQTAWHLRDKSANLVRTVALKGAAKTVLAVLPYQHLLDIKMISDQMQDEFNVMDDEQTAKIFDSCSETSFPPLPGRFDVHFVVDSSVLELPELYMESGNPNAIIQLDKASIEKVFKDCEVKDFASTPERLYAGRNADAGKYELDVSFTPIRLKQRIDDTFDLPAMPEIAQDIMKLRVDPSADANRLAQIVCRDPSLAAQVISWASSPYYGYQGKVDSVETAIARVLGFELVMNLALGISIGKSLKVPMDGPLGIRQFWRQAIYSANLAEKLCRAMPVKQRPERGLIYLSGLLHNFGHLLLGHIFPPQFKLINDTIQANPHIAVEDIEFYILGVTHEEIGAWLMNNWHMPDELIVAVRRHHQEEFWSKHAVYSNIVLVTNRMLKRLDIGDSVETAVPQSTLELLSLDEPTVEMVLEDIQSESETLDVMAKQLVA